jgi:hypothetical protein
LGARLEYIVGNPRSRSWVASRHYTATDPNTSEASDRGLSRWALSFVAEEEIEIARACHNYIVARPRLR